MADISATDALETSFIRSSPLPSPREAVFDEEPSSQSYVDTDVYERVDKVVPNYSTLQDIFNNVDCPMTDAYNMCVSLRPFVLMAIGRGESNTSALREVLEFIDTGMIAGSQQSTDDNKWSCTNGQFRAIAHMLNGDQFYIILDGKPDLVVPDTVVEDRSPRCKTAEEETLADDEFLRELSDLACDERTYPCDV